MKNIFILMVAIGLYTLGSRAQEAQTTGGDAVMVNLQEGASEGKDETFAQALQGFTKSGDIDNQNDWGFRSNGKLTKNEQITHQYQSEIWEKVSEDIRIERIKEWCSKNYRGPEGYCEPPDFVNYNYTQSIDLKATEWLARKLYVNFLTNPKGTFDFSNIHAHFLAGSLEIKNFIPYQDRKYSCKLERRHSEGSSIQAQKEVLTTPLPIRSATLSYIGQEPTNGYHLHALELSFDNSGWIYTLTCPVRLSKGGNSDTDLGEFFTRLKLRNLHPQLLQNIEVDQANLTVERVESQDRVGWRPDR